MTNLDADATTGVHSAPNTDSACCTGTVGASIDVAAATTLAARLGAIADPVRLQMLSILDASQTGEVCACDFVGPIDKSQPTISHHLKVLSEAGLVTGDKRGRWVWYRLADGALADIASSVTSLAGTSSAAASSSIVD